MEVGVRELKAKLSEYLERAAKGERITVTDRGAPKAILGPAVDDDPVVRGLREGWVTGGNSGSLPSFRPRRAVRSTDSVLREDRGDE